MHFSFTGYKCRYMGARLLYFSQTPFWAEWRRQILAQCCSRQKKLQSSFYTSQHCDPVVKRDELYLRSETTTLWFVVWKACGKDMSFRQRYCSVWADIGKNDIDALRCGLWGKSLTKANWLKKSVNIISSLPDLDAILRYHPWQSDV